MATLLEADRVEPLDVEFGDAVATCEQLGRGLDAFHSHEEEADEER
jgi:hypothetical protein